MYVVVVFFFFKKGDPSVFLKAFTVKAKFTFPGSWRLLSYVILVKENMSRTRGSAPPNEKSHACTRAFDAPDTSNCIMFSPNRSTGITLEEICNIWSVTPPPEGLNTGKVSENMSRCALPPRIPPRTVGNPAAWLLRRSFRVKYSFRVSLN